MNATLGLPLPKLSEGRFASLDLYSDDALFQATGVRIAFTERQGGVSVGPYASLDLASHVKDDLVAVARNRALLAEALGAAHATIINPNQVHGENVVSVLTVGEEAIAAVDAAARDGADALVVAVRDTAALLCYADCVPLVLVAPSGCFSVVHAGWRGVDAGIVVKALRALLAADGQATSADVNVYRGAYIHAECFETGADVHRRFVERFGGGVAFDATHIDLGRALDDDLLRAGVDPRRIADIGRCTVCDNRHWFSYRAQGGTCGRHGAFAVRLAQSSE